MAHKDATALTAVPRLRVLPVGQRALADAVTQREGTEARSGKMQQHATLCLVARTTSRTRTEGYAARGHRRERERYVLERWQHLGGRRPSESFHLTKLNNLNS